MDRKSPRERQDEQRLAERAAEWLSLLRTAGSAERAEFVDWAMESPRHLQEFFFATSIAAELRALDSSQLPQLRTSSNIGSANVVELPIQPSASIPSAPVPRHVRSTPWRWGLGLAAALALSVLGYWQFVPHWQTYATAVGEERAIDLPDGSNVHLNTRSRVQVRLAGRSRDIRLLEGEAIFKVEHDSARPFRVYSGPSVIQAIGTEFNVLRRPFGTTVSVIDGLVQISMEGGASTAPPSTTLSKGHQDETIPPISRLAAGEEARIDLSGHIERRVGNDVAAVAPWRHRRLNFRDDSLADIAAEFNRYNATPQIAVIGNTIRARRYTGSFDANDPNSLLAILRLDEDLALVSTGNELIVRAR